MLSNEGYAMDQKSLIEINEDKPETLKSFLKTPSKPVVSLEEGKDIIHTMKGEILKHPVVQQIGKLAGLAAPQMRVFN